MDLLLIQVLKPTPKSVSPTGQTSLNLVMIQNVRTIAYNKSTSTGLVVLVVLSLILFAYATTVWIRHRSNHGLGIHIDLDMQNMMGNPPMKV
jgi:predicted Na+-dependent transporter